jgi:glutaryl-CoA dehydrogenase
LNQQNRFVGIPRESAIAAFGITRGFVGWEPTGCVLAAFEHALAYARRRKQFGGLIGGFQLVRDQLVRTLSGVTTSMTSATG